MPIKVRQNDVWINLSPDETGVIEITTDDDLSAGDFVILNSNGKVEKVKDEIDLGNVSWSGPSELCTASMPGSCTAPYVGNTISFKPSDHFGNLVSKLNVLCIGGGGGGGSNWASEAGGGGAVAWIVLDVRTWKNTTFTIGVGAGGTGGYSHPQISPYDGWYAGSGGDTYLKSPWTELINAEGGTRGHKNYPAGLGGRYNTETSNSYVIEAGGGAGGHGGEREAEAENWYAPGGGGAGGRTGASNGRAAGAKVGGNVTPWTVEETRSGGRGGAADPWESSQFEEQESGHGGYAGSGAAGGGGANEYQACRNGTAGGGGGGVYWGGTGFLGQGDTGAGGVAYCNGGGGGQGGSGGNWGESGIHWDEATNNYYPGTVPYRGGDGGNYGGGGGKGAGRSDPTSEFYLPTYGGHGGKGAIYIEGRGFNLTSENYIGTSESAYVKDTTARINTIGTIDTNQSGLIAGKRYFLQKDGTLATTPDSSGVYVEVGIALSDTDLLLRW